MAITNAEIPARLPDMFAMTANYELVRRYPDESGGFVDGNFDSWQVGTSFSLSGQTKTYTADMWYCDAGFNGVATVSRDTRTLGSEPAAMERPSIYRLKFQQTTAASIESRIGQALESVAQYNGQSITVSYWLQSDVNMNVVNVNLIQNFGTGGSPSSTVTTTKAVTWAVTTTEKRFSVRLDVPSISGKTLGTNGNDFLAVELRTQTGLTFTLYVSKAQIDVCSPTASADTAGAGGAPQPFRYRGLAAEQARIAWYYKILRFDSPWNKTPSGIAGTTNSGTIFFPFEAMRSPPSATAQNFSNFVSATATGYAITSATVDQVSRQGVSVATSCSGGTPFIAGGVCTWQRNSSATPAPSIILDARL